jgi:tellurite methyltransferase
MTKDDQKRWDARWTARGDAPLSEPSPWLTSITSLPASGRALDVGSGSGRHALWLAAHGLDVTAVDISPIALERAEHEAGRRGLRLRTVCMDLDGDMPEGLWDVVLLSNFLHRPLLGRAADLLVPGGQLIVDHPTRTNLERHERPSARFLLEDGELPSLVPGLRIVHHSEAWRDNGRHEAHFIALKPT